MNIALQRTIDRVVGKLLCRLLSLWPRGPAVLPSQPQAFAIILLSEMGSLVLASPMLRHLQAHYPKTRLYAVVFQKNRELLDLLEILAPQDVLTIRDSSVLTFIWDSLRVVWQLRLIKPAATIDCELFARVSSLLGRVSGSPVQVGFHPHTQEGLYRGNFINRPVLYNPYLHISQQYLNLALALTSAANPCPKRVVADTLPKIPHKLFSSLEIDNFFIKLYQNFPHFIGQRLVLIYPSGGILPIRAWPYEFFLELCKNLLDDGLSIGIIGLKSDQMQATRLVAACASPQCVDLTGYTKNIRELLILFQKAALLVTNDGGPGHFAALTPIPCIVLFGPETPRLYGPLSANAHCFFTAMSCAPCLTAFNHRNSPCDGNNLCLQAITPASVLAKARKLLFLDVLPIK